MNLFKKISEEINLMLKPYGFQRRNNCWFKHANNFFIWIIDLQNDKSNLMYKSDITINVGVYVDGTTELIFGKKFSPIPVSVCFFNKRPRFFGSDDDWISIDEKNFVIKRDYIKNLFVNSIIPFLGKNDNIQSLINHLPIENWKSNENFHSELLRVACALKIMGLKREANAFLDIIILGKSIWAENAIHAKKNNGI